ncbi:hypothetical protein QYF61_012946 [Mycteria americana]|uniref:PRKR interacting protein 1 n=1 Tax=Mycteria americana TaxID=33587 RepID=A0AAN7NIK3_MYCAM|nr:hypothetical protein QYF61_012946 [Mycteria americana]
MTGRGGPAGRARRARDASGGAGRGGGWSMAAPSAPRPPRPRKEPQPLVIPRSAAEEQRLRLERLMRNPEKTVPIPEKLNEWAPRPPPEFVRDVMGSSAGAGSGEFHVYRHLRRREYQRQDFMDAMAEKVSLTFYNFFPPDYLIQKLKEKKLQAKKNKLEQKKQGKEPDQSQERVSSEDDEEDSKEEEEKEDDAEEPSFVMGRG